MKRERQDKKWAENQEVWKEHLTRHEETQREWNKRWDENQGKWEENQKVINEMLASIKHLESRFDQSIGSIGARWGIYSDG